MQIYTVKSGDTVFNIARRYATSPMKIIENNNLVHPDRLSVGQKLLILTPTRTYTVRAGDTLSSVARRFGVCEEELLIHNPALLGDGTLYPSQVLVVRQDRPNCGTAVSNGYLYEGASDERFLLMLPYLTHLTVSAYERSGDKILRIWNSDKYEKLARDRGKVLLMRVYYGEGKEGLTEEFADALIKSAKNGGYNGITLAAYRAFEDSREEFAQFLEGLYKKTLDSGLLLYCEADANKKQNSLSEFCDGYILMYEKCHLPEIPSFEHGERAAYGHYADIYESSKMFIDFSPFGIIGNESITKREAEELAYNSKSEIKYDAEHGICSFDYKNYKGGRREIFPVKFEALENIKAKLDIIFELGFIGMSFDIMRTPIEVLLMFSSMYSLPDTECFVKLQIEN